MSQTIQSIFDRAVEMGIAHDIRGKAFIQRRLKKTKEKYEQLSAKKKEYFDIEELTNPFSDARLYTDSPKKVVKRVLAGIDIESTEVLLAHEISEKKPIDLIISHHPFGSALADLSSVMDLQVELLAHYGMPINVAQSVTMPRIGEIERGISGLNHYREIDAAKLLGLSLACVHTPTDNMASMFMMNLVEKNKKKLERLSDVMDLLMTVPEYQQAEKMKTGPRIYVGNANSYAGKIAVAEFTGGTNGSKEIYEKMAHAGIGTVLSMHMHEEYKKMAEKYHVNVIVAGHMSSDSLGMNIFLDEVEKKGVEVISCSGLIRVKRFATKK